MRAIWKGTISFGLVTIPIGVGLATKRSDPAFRTLDRESLQPVRQQLYSPARETTVGRDETVKGYEVSKDSYLPVSDEELESVAVERRRTIDILAFVDAEEVDPVYYDRTYYLDPQEHAQKPYALLLEAMRESGKAAVGKIVMSSKEYLALIRPAGDSLVIELLFYPEDVRPKEEIEEKVREVDVTEAELGMARQLIDSLARPFEPESFHNEHKRQVLELIERKMAGEEAPVPAEAPAPAPVPDLMAALKASIEQARSPGGGDEEPSGEGNGGTGGRARAKRKAAVPGPGGGKSSKPAAKGKAPSKSGNGAKPKVGAGKKG